MATNPTDNTTNGWVAPIPTPAVDTATQAPAAPWATPYISSTIANPDGNPVNATTTPEVNQVVPTTPIAPMSTVEPKTVDAAASNVVNADLGIGVTASQEANSQIDLTKKLGAIDVNQMQTKVANAQDNFTEAQKIQTDQMIQKNANELEYQKKLQAETEANVAAAKMQQDSENKLNAATAAELKLKQDNAEKDAAIANDVAAQSSAIAFAKLWLSFSGAAINTSQAIFAQGARNIAELKSTNAKNYADLMVKIDRVAFDHQTVINSIISDANEKQFASKERLRDFIGNAQTNILTSKKEAQTAIQDAITTYKTEVQGREDKMYADMNAANARLLTATKDIQTTVDAQAAIWKTKIDLMIKSWQWAGLSTAQQTQYELDANLPVGTTNRTSTILVTQWINDRLKELTWANVTIPVPILQNMQTDIKKYTDMGYWIPVATQMVVDMYKNYIPEAKAYIEANKSKAASEAEKLSAETAKLKAEADWRKSEAAKLDVEAAKAKATPIGWWTKQTAYSATTEGQNPLVQVNGVPYTINEDGSRWAVYNWKVINKETPQAMSAADIAIMDSLGLNPDWTKKDE